MIESPRPVLVGIDGTPSGLEALALGSAFAVLTGSPLLLGAVIGYQGGAFAGRLVWLPQTETDRWLRDAADRLEDFIPWSSETMLSTSAAHGLIDLAESKHAAMIVLGSNRHGPVGHVLAGSTARRVAHGSPCPVAIAPHDWRTQPPDVPLTFGVGVGDAPESRDALALAARFAELGHAPLKLFTAVQAASPAHPMYAATGTSYERLRRERYDTGQRTAHDAVEAVAPEVTPEIVVVEGDPVECLVRASHDLDVLVVGSRRFGPLRSALLGSVSSPLIERAACPVVIVPRGVHAEAADAVAEEPAHA
jgi:nucleotide-binding universal stress UspA family protein